MFIKIKISLPFTCIAENILDSDLIPLQQVIDKFVACGEELVLLVIQQKVLSSSLLWYFYFSVCMYVYIYLY